MLTFKEVVAIIDDIWYEDWTKEIRNIDEKLSLFRWIWEENGELQRARFWVIDHTQPHSDIVRTVLAATLMAEEHEARERFRYKGKRVFNPHYNIDKLAEISGRLENLEIPDGNS
jgi:hypothetical protein